jgi:hypothetical protein
MGVDQAQIQGNLGAALYIVGERERVGRRSWEAAVAAHREALTERTCDRVPLDWATSLGNERIALMLLAERREMRKSAPSQNAAEFELMLTRAQQHETW